MPEAAETSGTRIPLWVKLAYTGFVCILVPYYWHDYGPTNFLYFCDVAVFMALVALWTEKSIWASMPAVGILLPQALWMVDFLGGLLGLHVVGMTAYMFDAGIPLFTRALSLFHFWLPLFLIWIIWRLGYDRRAFWAWTALAWVLLLVCYFLMPVPPAPPENPNLPVNINYVYGPSDAGPQQWMPPLLYFGLLMVGLPLCVFLPTHMALCRVFRASDDQPRRTAGQSDAGTHLVLRTAGILGPLGSAVVVAVLAYLFAVDGWRGVALMGEWYVMLSGLIIWIPAHILAGSLYLYGLWAQAHSGKWIKGWTVWNGLYFGIVLLLLLLLPLLSAVFAASGY